MKITFTRGTGLGGIGKDAFPGEVLDLPEAQARAFIAQGRAVEGGELKKSPKKAAPAVSDDGNNGDA